MKYCRKCNKKFDTDKDMCPICSDTFRETPNDVANEMSEVEAAESVSSMMVIQICT